MYAGRVRHKAENDLNRGAHGSPQPRNWEPEAP